VRREGRREREGGKVREEEEAREGGRKVPQQKGVNTIIPTQFQHMY